MLRVHPTVSADWTVPMAYGATETMTINTSNAPASSTQEKAGRFGVPLPGNLLKIVAVEPGAVVPRGQRGEVCIKVQPLMQGDIGTTAAARSDEPPSELQSLMRISYAVFCSKNHI